MNFSLVGEIQQDAGSNQSIRSIVSRHQDGKICTCPGPAFFLTDLAYNKGYGNNSIVPFLRWNGFKGPKDVVDGGYQTGISDRWGQFLAIWFRYPYINW